MEILGYDIDSGFTLTIAQSRKRARRADDRRDDWALVRLNLGLQLSTSMSILKMTIFS